MKVINTITIPKGIEFQVRACHSTLYVVDLPSFLPESAQDQLTSVFMMKLQDELKAAFNVMGKLNAEPFQPSHKSKGDNLSHESVNSTLTISTAGGSADGEGAANEDRKYELMSTST
jgi:hypothetical protein